MSRRIEIVEVGPREGLQNEPRGLSPTERAAFIHRLEDAGACRLETVAFIDAKRSPQIADPEAVMAALPPAPGRCRIGVVFDEEGWERCRATGCDEAQATVSASETFALKTEGRAVVEQLAVLEILVRRHAVEGGPPVGLTITAAFGDPYDGEVGEDRVVAIAAEAHRLRLPEIVLADSIGAADPWTVRRRIEAVRAAAPHARLRMRFHDTRSAGLANAFAAIQAGVESLDASVGGLGLSSFAPGGRGVVATEDLVWMLHRAGFETGYDLAVIIAEGRRMRGRLGRSGATALGRAGDWPRP